jgi:hypothetical protein
MILDLTTLKLESVLAAAVTANQPEVHVFYQVQNIKNEQSKKATYRTALNSTTDVTILAAPTTQGEIREILTLQIYNKDTANVTVTVKTDDGTTERIMLKKLLLVGETLEWNRETGWFII